MERRALLPVLALALALSGAAHAAAPLPDLTAEELRKIDPRLAVAASATRGPAAAAPAPAPLGPLALAAGVRLDASGEAVADVLIEVEGGDTGALTALGLVPDAVVGEITSARAVPLALLPALARLPEVAAVQAARRLEPMNDLSIPEIGAPGVWSELGATGQGVIVSVVDTGIDWDHPDFQNADGSTRIQYILDLSQEGNGPFGGTLFTAAQIDQGIVARDPVGHGTHIAASAAGAGRADTTFRGAAYESDLIIVNADRNGDGTFSDTDIVNSLAFVDERAALLGQPYVVNLSLGGHGGAHDGSALQERAIDALFGAGKPGKAVSIAAGNDRSGAPRHAAASVSGSGLDLRLSVPSYTPQPGDQNDLTVVTLWYEASTPFTVTLITPGGTSLGPFAPGEWNGESGTDTPDGVIGIQNAASGTSPQNGDLEATIVLIDAPTVPASGTWTIRLGGATGAFDAYVAFGTFDAFFTSHVVTDGFVAEPGTARNAITVSAYTTKIQWTDRDGNPHQLSGVTRGEIASFSNSGPTRDGRQKPEIAAPGMVIASAYSEDAPPGSPGSLYTSPFPQFPNFFILAGDRYAIQLGTSMATGHVTGALALLLELRPDWDALDLKRALTATARADAFTGSLPNARFGFGKLDVLEAARAAAMPDTLPPGDVNGDGTADLDDALLAIGFVLGTQAPTPAEERRTDLNADGLLDVGDVVLVARAAVGAGAGTPGTGPEAEEGGDIWVLPIAFAAGGKGAVVGAELELEYDPARVVPLAGDIGARPGVLALGASRASSARLGILALALDGRDLAAGGATVRVPFTVRAGGEPGRGGDPPWRLVAARLAGAGGERVEGEGVLGAPELESPAALRIHPVAVGTGPARITFDLPGPGAARVRAAIYDATGRLVTHLADDLRPPGRHVIAWDGAAANGRALPSGIYWVRIAARDEDAVERLVRVR